jgi:type IV pilus assembly protein PilA
LKESLEVNKFAVDLRAGIAPGYFVECAPRGKKVYTGVAWETAPAKEFQMKARNRQRGFSLIELLIVVAIILIIASIAIPNLLRARMSANEAAAVQAVRTVNTAQISYNSSYPSVGFASTLGALGGTACNPPTSAGACLIDTQLASGTKSGYTFTLAGVTGTPSATYVVIASPVTPNQTGTRYFCSFADAVVRTSPTAIATCDGSIPPLQ